MVESFEADFLHIITPSLIGSVNDIGHTCFLDLNSIIPN